MALSQLKFTSCSLGLGTLGCQESHGVSAGLLPDSDTFSLWAPMVEGLKVSGVFLLRVWIPFHKDTTW